jgi:hypothetical protein
VIPKGGDCSSVKFPTLARTVHCGVICRAVTVSPELSTAPDDTLGLKAFLPLPLGGVDPGGNRCRDQKHWLIGRSLGGRTDISMIEISSGCEGTPAG